MTRARKTGGVTGSGAKNAIIPPMKGGNKAMPIANSIAVRPGSQDSKCVKNAIALKKSK